MDDGKLDRTPCPDRALLQAAQAGQEVDSLTTKVPPEHELRLARELGKLVGGFIADEVLKKAERN